MSFLRKSPSHRATIILSLADLLQPTAAVASLWPASQTADSLNKWAAKSIVASSDGSASTAIDKALASKLSVPEMRPVSRHDFDRDNLISWNAWHHGGEVQVALKGALEPLLSYTQLTENEQENIRLQMAKMTKGSRQVIAVAHNILAQVPADGRDILSQGKLTIDGLVALDYPSLASTASLVESLRTGSQPVKLLSGESVEMIAELVAKWNLSDNPDVFDCRQLATLGAAKAQRIDGIDAFARIDSDSLPLLLNMLRQEAPLSASSATKQYLGNISSSLPEISSRNLL